jgi:hypothetical protein
VRILGSENVELRDVWAYLTEREARDLLLSLQFWEEDVTEGHNPPGWHTHISDQGRELTIAIDDRVATGDFAKPS